MRPTRRVDAGTPLRDQYAVDADPKTASPESVGRGAVGLDFDVTDQIGIARAAQRPGLTASFVIAKVALEVCVGGGVRRHRRRLLRLHHHRSRRGWVRGGGGAMLLTVTDTE